MFHRLARHCRPLALRTSRSFCSRGNNIPVHHARYPFRRSPFARFFDDFFTPGFPSRNWIDGIEKQFEDHMNQIMRNSEFGFSRHGGVQVTHNKSLFEVKVDVQDFKPDQLEVKLTDNRLLVSAKHEQRADDHHGFVKREFQREFEVPKDVLVETMESSVSEEGILTIRADVKKEPDTVIEIKRENSS